MDKQQKVSKAGVETTMTKRGLDLIRKFCSERETWIWTMTSESTA